MRTTINPVMDEGLSTMEAPITLMYWALEDLDGTTYVLYDLATGEQHKVPDPNFRRWKSVAWIPFTDASFVDLINERQAQLPNPSYVDLSTLPVLHVKLRDDEEARVFFRGKIEYSDFYECGECGTAFLWMREDTDPYPVCPKCGACNTWFCDIHGEVTPIFLQNGERRCPICEKQGPPRGCSLIRRLFLRTAVRKELAYCIQVKRGDIITEYVINKDGIVTVNSL